MFCGSPGDLISVTGETFFDNVWGPWASDVIFRFWFLKGV
jgi:hypothetical protein